MAEPILLDRRQPTASEPEGPWWIRFATVFGVPALLAIYFSWSMVSGQSTILHNIERLLYAQEAQISEVAEVARKTAEISTASSLRIESYMRQICVNSAKSQTERNICLSVR
jgi:hypothetical protein